MDLNKLLALRVGTVTLTGGGAFEVALAVSCGAERPTAMLATGLSFAKDSASWTPLPEDGWGGLRESTPRKSIPPSRKHIDKPAGISDNMLIPPMVLNQIGGTAMKQCMDAENLHRRFKKILGQVQAIDRMVDEDIPCEDILAQINAAKSALHRAGQVVLEGHIKHCVRDGIEHGDADQTIASFTKAVERFANMN